MRGLTQRQFAAKLTDAGMVVDASAVSRIEKGTRSIRLVEAMVIANVLDVDVDFLVQGVRTPEQELKDIRRSTNLFMNQMDKPFALFAFGLMEAKWFLEDHPELLDQVTDDGAGELQSADGYLPWVAERMRRLDVDEDDLVPTRTAREADQLVEVMIAWISRRIGPEIFGEEDNGEHSEEA
jgi:transcriptional regulator with XRE-family HTH domain